MKFSKWIRNDGYWESFASFNEGLNNIFRLRVVLQSNGKLKPIVRDFLTMKLLGSGNQSNFLDESQIAAEDIVINFIKSSILDRIYERS